MGKEVGSKCFRIQLGFIDRSISQETTMNEEAQLL